MSTLRLIHKEKRHLRQVKVNLQIGQMKVMLKEYGRPRPATK